MIRNLIQLAATVLLLTSQATVANDNGAAGLLGGITDELDTSGTAVQSPVPRGLPTPTTAAAPASSPPQEPSGPTADDRQARIDSAQQELDALRRRISSIVDAPSGLGGVDEELAGVNGQIESLDRRKRELRAGYDQKLQELAETSDRGEIDARMLARLAASRRGDYESALAELERERPALQARRDQLTAERNTLDRLASAPAEQAAREVFNLRKAERDLENEIAALRGGPDALPASEIGGSPFPDVGRRAPEFRLPELSTLAERAREEGAAAERSVNDIIERELRDLEQSLRDSGLDAPETLERFLGARREELESQRADIARAVREVAAARAEGLDNRSALLAIDTAPLKAGSLVELDLTLIGDRRASGRDGIKASERFSSGAGQRTVVANYLPLHIVYTLRAETERNLAPLADRAGDLQRALPVFEPDPIAPGDPTSSEVARVPFWTDVRNWLIAVERVSRSTLTLRQRDDAPVRKFFDDAPSAEVTCTSRYQPGDAESLVEETIVATAQSSAESLAGWQWPDERPPAILILQGRPEDLATIRRLGPRLSRPPFEPDGSDLQTLESVWQLNDEVSNVLATITPNGNSAYGVVVADVNTTVFDGAPLAWSAERTERTGKAPPTVSRFNATGGIGEPNPSLPGCRLGITPASGLIRAPAGTSLEVSFQNSLRVTSRQSRQAPVLQDGGYQVQVPWRGRASGREEVRFVGGDANQTWDHGYEIRWRLKPLSEPAKSRI